MVGLSLPAVTVTSDVTSECREYSHLGRHCDESLFL